jgi:lipopolysaccharide/colanic/teichoic acid biosynthesis glycosyltransferase
MSRVRVPVEVSRILDIAVIIIGLPILLPLAAVVALLVAADSPGPVIYRCRRVGQYGRPFTMYKFRKMHREASGSDLTLIDDERFTPIGRFLSRSRLDEIPQVWNVLKGDMRVVGPRPEVEAFVRLYPDEFGEILKVKPGITGLAQLEYAYEGKMFQDFTECLSLYCLEVLPPKLELDARYVRTHNSFLDLFILMRTALLPLEVPRAQLRHSAPRHAIVRALPGTCVALVALLLMGTFVIAAGPVP